MKNLKKISFLKKKELLLVVACSLGGCSTIQSWFPDKEKDYQFTTELPSLIIPPDLVQKTVVSSRSLPVELPASKTDKMFESVASPKLVEKTIKPIIKSVPTTKEVARPILSDTETELSRDEIQISLTHEDIPTLNLNVPVVRAWRIVGKALSRSNIEVTNRNQERGQIHIADSSLKAHPEKSLWDNTISVFNPFAENEQSYVLQFREVDSKTTVTILSAELQPLTNGTDNKLLTMLFDLIKADLGK